MDHRVDCFKYYWSAQIKANILRYPWWCYPNRWFAKTRKVELADGTALFWKMSKGKMYLVGEVLPSNSSD